MENYKDITPMQQLTKQGVDESTGQKKAKKIFPISITSAIYDTYTKKTLYDILNHVNCIYVDFKTDVATTRLSVDLAIRKRGLIVVFVQNQTIYTQMYINDYIADSYWKSDSNWQNVSIGDNILLGYEQNNRNFPVQVDENKKAFVNVPAQDVENYELPIATDKTIGGIKTKMPFFTNDEGILAMTVNDMQLYDSALNPYQVAEWKEDSDMNSYVENGTYRLYGVRTNANDNLPVEGIGEDNTFEARLFILNSSISGTAQANKSKCVTQVLFISNRNDGDGYVYIRTGHATSKNELIGGAGWSDWNLVNRHNATQETDGYMSKEDKTKLDNLTGATIKITTQAEYDNLEAKDENTVYFIKG